MLVRGAITVLSGLFDAVFRPSQFVNAQRATYSTSRLAVISQVLNISAVWAINLTLYALPLTLAGIGFTATGDAPPSFAATVEPFVRSPDTAWQLLVGFVQNSVFLTVATVIALIAFHGSVLVARGSRGIVQSIHTVVYTTSAYLAGMFTVVMYLSTASGVDRTREFVVNLQANVIQWTIDLMGVDLSLSGIDPGPLTLAGISQTGASLLSVLTVLTFYFIYSMYLGARLNHEMSRTGGVIVIVSVLASPVVYIAGSAAVTILFETYGIQVLPL